MPHTSDLTPREMVWKAVAPVGLRGLWAATKRRLGQRLIHCQALIRRLLTGSFVRRWSGFLRISWKNVLLVYRPSVDVAGSDHERRWFRHPNGRRSTVRSAFEHTSLNAPGATWRPNYQVVSLERNGSGTASCVSLLEVLGLKHQGHQT